jgi:hypothetical protein
MKGDETHAMQHALVHSLDDVVADAVVGSMAPPEEHVRFGEDGVSQAVLGFVDSGEADLYFAAEASLERLANDGVQAVGIDRADLSHGLFVDKLIPNRYAQR